ncbi:MAG: hypothetical protein HYV26_08270 [Candidatus Hydrogenedentes bacterium]|nr:hypothetical protein [Candidatus Hydrogenedentota bacterium]
MIQFVVGLLLGEACLKAFPLAKVLPLQQREIYRHLILEALLAPGIALGVLSLLFAVGIDASFPRDSLPPEFWIWAVSPPFVFLGTAFLLSRNPAAFFLLLCLFGWANVGALLGERWPLSWRYVWDGVLVLGLIVPAAAALIFRRAMYEGMYAISTRGFNANAQEGRSLIFRPKSLFLEAHHPLAESAWKGIYIGCIMGAFILWDLPHSEEEGTLGSVIGAFIILPILGGLSLRDFTWKAHLLPLDSSRILIQTFVGALALLLPFVVPVALITALLFPAQLPELYGFLAWVLAFAPWLCLHYISGKKGLDPSKPDGVVDWMLLVSVFFMMASMFFSVLWCIPFFLFGLLAFRLSLARRRLRFWRRA